MIPSPLQYKSNVFFMFFPCLRVNLNIIDKHDAKLVQLRYEY
jgi:hypothetical protein